MKTFCFIFARGGSKGIRKKNIRNLFGKPLIAYSLIMAKDILEIDEVFVSTDSNEIAEVAILYGANIIKRPANLAEDNSPEWLAWMHAVKWAFEKYGPFAKFLSLPATAPLRSKEDVKKCLEKFKLKNDVILTMTEANRNPWFNMVKRNKEGLIELAIQSKEKLFRRQDAPLVYDLTTVAYVLNPNFILENKSIWDGNVHGVYVPKERAIDIDSEYDLKLAEYLISKKDAQNDLK